MAKKKKKSNNMVDRYHGPLIENEVMLGHIKFVPWFTLVLSGIAFWGMTIGDWPDVYITLFGACTYYSAFAIFISFFDKFILKFKSFVYLLISLVFLVLTIDLSCISLLLISEGELSSGMMAVCIYIELGLFLISSSVYAWYYLPKNQGNIWAINQWQTYENILKNKKLMKFLKPLPGIVFALIVIAVFSEHENYVECAFGVISGILFLFTFPALVVDAIYGAIYIRKNPSYDELR